MTVREKYQSLIDQATQEGATNLKVSEKNGVLHIEGEVPTTATKDKLWAMYEQIDPNFRAGDLILNIEATTTEGGKLRIATKSSNLNIRQAPGTDQPIVGKAAKDEVVTLLNKDNDQWWLIKTSDGEQGYAYAQYLEPIQ